MHLPGSYDHPKEGVLSPMVSLPKLFTNYHLKLMAALFMVIDHVGAIFFPDMMVLRWIGRFSLPLFAWLLVQGEIHTKNIWKYGLRLLLLGLISQPIYVLAFELQGIRDYNILFTLLIGLVCLRLGRIFPNIFALLVIWISGASLAHWFHVDYGSYGIAIIAFISRFKPTLIWWLCWLGLNGMVFASHPGYATVQGCVVLTPILFHMANLERGGRVRWFYGFYPGHLLILYLIHLWL